MPISVTCPGCDRGLKAPDSSAGRKIKCPKCNAVVPVPDVEGEEEAAAVATKKSASGLAKTKGTAEGTAA